MEFKEKLLNILEDLSKHKRDSRYLLEHYIKKRLNTSLMNYSKDLELDSKYLMSKDANKVLRILNKRELR